MKLLQTLNEIGVEPVLLTGDAENAAKSIAQKLNIKEIHFSCLPEDKLNCIDSYQKKGQPVCMIGDGINDAFDKTSTSALAACKKQEQFFNGYAYDSPQCI